MTTIGTSIARVIQGQEASIIPLAGTTLQMLEHGGVVAALVLFAIIEGFVIWVYDKRLRLSTESALAIQENSFKQMMVIDARSSEQKSELINSLKANTDVIKSVLDTLHSNSDTLRSNTEAVRTLSEKVAVLSDRTARE